MLDMTKYCRKSEIVADNTLVINGMSYLVSDSFATDIMGMIESTINNGSGNVIVGSIMTNESLVEKINTSATSNKSDNKPIEYNYKDHNVSYEVAKVETIDGKTVYLIRPYKLYKASATLKKVVNNHIRSIDKIKAYKYQAGEKTYIGYGFATKKTAENYMAMLPTTITADELKAYNNR